MNLIYFVFYFDIYLFKIIFIKIKSIYVYFFLYIEYNEYIKKINIGCSFCGILLIVCMNLLN